MKYFKISNSSTIERGQKEFHASSTVETEPLSSLSTRRTNIEKSDDSSGMNSSVCFFMHSGGVINERHSILQETELRSENWNGYIVGIEEESLILDVRNVEKPQKRLKIRVKKNIVEGDLNRLNENVNVVVSYKRVRNYKGSIEKRVSVRLREPAIIPEEILERELEDKMKQYSYMFSEE